MGQRRLGLAPHLPWRCFNLYFTKSLSWFSSQALTHLLLTKEDVSLAELLDGLEVGLEVVPAVKQCCRSGEWMRHTVLSRCLHGQHFQPTSQAEPRIKALQSIILIIAGKELILSGTFKNAGTSTAARKPRLLASDLHLLLVIMGH